MTLMSDVLNFKLINCRLFIKARTITGQNQTYYSPVS